MTCPKNNKHLELLKMLLSIIFRYHGSVMEMVRLTSMKDWETLPLTKHKIKQPSLSEKREDALQTGR